MHTCAIVHVNANIACAVNIGTYRRYRHIGTSIKHRKYQSILYIVHDVQYVKNVQCIYFTWFNLITSISNADYKLRMQKKQNINS